MEKELEENPNRIFFHLPKELDECTNSYG